MSSGRLPSALIAATAASVTRATVPPPAGVHAGQHVRDRVIEHDRHAVGDHGHEDDPGLRGHQRVGAGDRVILRQRAQAPVGRGDDVNGPAMRLVAVDHVAEVCVERARRPPPVLKDVLVVVAHMQAQVERLIAALRDPAAPGRHQRIDVEPVEGRPGQHLQLG